MPAAGLPQLRPPCARPPPGPVSVQPPTVARDGALGAGGHRPPSGRLPYRSGCPGPLAAGRPAGPHHLPAALGPAPPASRSALRPRPQHPAASGLHRPAPTVTSPAPEGTNRAGPRTLQGPAHCLAHSRPSASPALHTRQAPTGGLGAGGRGRGVLVLTSRTRDGGNRGARGPGLAGGAGGATRPSQVHRLPLTPPQVRSGRGFPRAPGA